MQVFTHPGVFLFADFRLDRPRGGLFRRGENGTEIPVALGSRALDILALLIERVGGLVTKDEITDAVWQGAVVEDSNLTVHIAALRRILDKGRAQGSCIQTVVGRGYRFVADVVRLDAEGPANARVSGATTPRSIGDAQRVAPAASGQFLSHGHPAPAIIRPSPDQGRTDATGPPHLSIVVLPFADLSDCANRQLFADRITDDLTTGLSRFTSTVVTSRTTASTYRNKSLDTRQIGQELGVRYVLEGSVQRFPNHIRVNTGLIDAQTDAHLWSGQFDRDPADPFAVQDEVGKRIEVRVYQELITPGKFTLHREPRHPRLHPAGTGCSKAVRSRLLR